MARKSDSVSSHNLQHGWQFARLGLRHESHRSLAHEVLRRLQRFPVNRVRDAYVICSRITPVHPRRFVMAGIGGLRMFQQTT